MRKVILLDNGSSRAQSTLTLRRLAASLEGRIGAPVQPVSLLHADKVAPELLDGRGADTLEPFLRGQAAEGGRAFLILPLFFGPSRALSAFIPEMIAGIGSDTGPLDVQIADVLYPLPDGEALLVDILADNLRKVVQERNFSMRHVVLVDHGSPIPEVTAVRRDLAGRLRERLGSGVRVEEAVMERRRGSEYDFNGDLLEEVLRRAARSGAGPDLALSMLFLSAGRHAGVDGDVERICRAVESEFPPFRVHSTPLVGSHPKIIDILQSRYEQSL
jgi:sirohydrochlorin ferrochelatase